MPERITENITQAFVEKEFENASTTTQAYILAILVILFEKDDDWLERFYIKLKNNKVK